MLSYRHSYHAGNHADVLKHLVLVQLLRYLGQKDKGFQIVDTHAGAGLYALDSEHASKLEEHNGGIARLWDRKDLPPAVAEYVAEVRALNNGGALQSYPGSPWLSHRALREQDRLRLFELHSTDYRTLANYFNHLGGKQTIVYADDGFAHLKALLPPPTRRGLVLIDPSYELKEDYGRVLGVLRECLERFATGTYAVWYPMLPKLEATVLPERLVKIGAANWLHVTLSVRKAATDGGMHGSGMFVINPPWTLAQTLKAEMPWLRDALAESDGASFTLDHVSV
ncbi:MAG: 23S rRNA (adenine(2030)-N(6))-methyltransferase RlmJ [Rhodocyclaceae bacterium]